MFSSFAKFAPVSLLVLFHFLLQKMKHVVKQQVIAVLVLGLQVREDNSSVDSNICLKIYYA